MECNAVKATAALKFICPMYGEVDTDTFEVLDTEAMHAINCSACNRLFRLMAFECERCAGETALSWSESQVPEQVDHPVCAHHSHRTTQLAVRRNGGRRKRQREPVFAAVDLQVQWHRRP